MYLAGGAAGRRRENRPAVPAGEGCNLEDPACRIKRLVGRLWEQDKTSCCSHRMCKGGNSALIRELANGTMDNYFYTLGQRRLDSVAWETPAPPQSHPLCSSLCAPPRKPASLQAPPGVKPSPEVRASSRRDNALDSSSHYYYSGFQRIWSVAVPARRISAGAKWRPHVTAVRLAIQWHDANCCKTHF